MCFWERNVEKGERICPKLSSKMPNFSSFFDLRGSGGIYNDFVTLGR